ncbi:MAG: thioesterase II family protein, partial [Blastocatellia bacterium]
MRSAIDMGADRPWFIRTNPRPNARMRLFCFPYAGGAAAIYRLWPNGLPSDVEIVALELPGRGGRMKEAGFRNVSKLITAIAEVIAPRIDREFAFFGHSMGALIAFELARELRRQGRPQPQCLFVSGRRAPHIPDTDPITYNLPEAEFIQELRKLNGTPKEVLDHEELM